MRAPRRPRTRPRRTVAVSTSLTALVAGALLTVGATSSAAAPSIVPATSTASVASQTTPAPSPTPDDGEPEGLPWPGIIVGGGLGLAAGTVLMVLSRRRENRD